MKKLAQSRWIWLLAVALLTVNTGCGKKKKRSATPPPPAAGKNPPPPPAARAGTLPPAGSTAGKAAPNPKLDELYGLASWYGHPYHGRRTASGEVYDMYKMTAAHKTLSLGTMVEVTNADNGRQVQVRINDRGPFIEGRVIDLSYTAAQAIEMVGKGTAWVSLAILGDPPRPVKKAPGPERGGTAEPAPAEVRPHPGGPRYSVQVGSFRERDNAEKVRSRMERDHSPVEIRQDGSLFRVLVGSLQTQDEAKLLARELRGLVVLLP